MTKVVLQFAGMGYQWKPYVLEVGYFYSSTHNFIVRLKFRSITGQKELKTAQYCIMISTNMINSSDPVP